MSSIMEKGTATQIGGTGSHVVDLDGRRFHAKRQVAGTAPTTAFLVQFEMCSPLRKKHHGLETTIGQKNRNRRNASRNDERRRGRQQSS